MASSEGSKRERATEAKPAAKSGKPVAKASAKSGKPGAKPAAKSGKPVAKASPKPAAKGGKPGAKPAAKSGKPVAKASAPSGPRLGVSLDGQELAEGDARALWEAFSAYMDEHRGDLAGFAAARGYRSVRPEYQRGRALLIVEP